MMSKSPRIKTTEALLDGYSSLNVDRLMSPLSSDFSHQVLPESLGMPIRNANQFAEHAAQIFSVFSQFCMSPKAIFEDQGQNVVVVHARMEGTLKGSNEEWLNECVMIICLSEDGTQVVQIKEFVDSSKAIEMRTKHVSNMAE
ncbi:hypothetical protein F5883DRAFT_553157 [Diaporthe sp. PMI_573]|nr:hypothetical protein F5883DRAFT_553157 [Diaporthaceae sp. PMI_573]